MRALPTFFQNLFGVGEEDHLMGAVDLSDAAYCLELLARNVVADCEQFLPQCIETPMSMNAANQVS